jgi:hypothetical protein
MGDFILPSIASNPLWPVPPEEELADVEYSRMFEQIV